MPDKVQEFVARASLDNLWLPAGIEILQFSGFFIKKSPNCVREVVRTLEDGTEETTLTYLDEYEDEYQPDFPNSEYYLELQLGKTKPSDFDIAEEKLIWALDRLRLFKSGLLWGELYGIFDPKEHPVGCYEVKRTKDQGPFPSTDLRGAKGIFIVRDYELDSIVASIDDLNNVPTDPFAVALRRFHLYFDRDLTQDRAIDLMIVLESIFSDDRQAISYKIALRTACLIESDPQKRKALFDFLKKAYDERSHIIHGKANVSWFEQETYTPAHTNLESLEEVVRRSLLILLKNAQNGLILKPPDLDDYLFFDQGRTSSV